MDEELYDTIEALPGGISGEGPSMVGELLVELIGATAKLNALMLEMEPGEGKAIQKRLKAFQEAVAALQCGTPGKEPMGFKGRKKRKQLDACLPVSYKTGIWHFEPAR